MEEPSSSQLRIARVRPPKGERLQWHRTLWRRRGARRSGQGVGWTFRGRPAGGGDARRRSRTLFQKFAQILGLIDASDRKSRLILSSMIRDCVKGLHTFCTTPILFDLTSSKCRYVFVNVRTRRGVMSNVAFIFLFESSLVIFFVSSTT